METQLLGAGGGGNGHKWVKGYKLPVIGLGSPGDPMHSTGTVTDSTVLHTWKSLGEDILNVLTMEMRR